MLKSKFYTAVVLVVMAMINLSHAELLVHLDGSVAGTDPNVVFEDRAKNNDALPESSDGSEVGVGNVLDIYQSSFGIIGDSAIHVGPHENRAANIPADSPDLNKSFQQFTLSLWFKPDVLADTDSYNHYIVGKMGGSGNRGWRMERVDDDSQVLFMYFDGPNGSNHSYGMFPVAGTGVFPADFTHLAVTFEGGVAVKMYGNGVKLRELGALSALNGANAAPLQVGNSGSYGRRSAEGIIDDLGIWDEVLSEQRIAAIYALGYFEDIDLQDSRIDSFLDAFNAQGSVNINCNVWEYITGLPTNLGQTGGSVAACNAYVVLDSSGNGMALTSCSSPLQSDITSDCQVNIDDFAMLAAQWLDSNL
jgi:hypothetical protein